MRAQLLAACARSGAAHTTRRGPSAPAPPGRGVIPGRSGEGQTRKRVCQKYCSSGLGFAASGREAIHLRRSASARGASCFILFPPASSPKHAASGRGRAGVMCACDGIDQVRSKRLTCPAAPGDCTRPGVAHTPADAMGRAEDTPLSRLFCNNQRNSSFGQRERVKAQKRAGADQFTTEQR